jgi:ABC-2 type transport system permease protein
MMSPLQAAWVIARRDFMATVMSRTFILFLIFPMIIISVSGGLGAMNAKRAERENRPRVAVLATPADFQPIDAARERLKPAFGEYSLAELIRFDPDADEDSQTQALLGATDKRLVAVLSGLPAHPRVTGSFESHDSVAGQIRMMLDDEARQAAMAKAGVRASAVPLKVVSVGASAGSLARDRGITAQIAVTLLFMATVMLASMLLSNMIEEKSNKVIEVLASAIPVDAVFFGKLAAMLTVSLVGLALWMSAGIVAAKLWSSGGSSLPAPAVGWTAFLIMGFVYFSMNYLLLGALFLGIGSQASSVREVQTISMPVTIGQVIIFFFVNQVASSFDGPLGIAAAVFPFSSPLMMMARAAQTGELWPHLVALLWQALWVWLIVRLGAAFFRSNVLKSGGGPSAAFGFRRRA